MNFSKLPDWGSVVLLSMLVNTAGSASTSTFFDRELFVSATSALPGTPEAISFDSLVWAPSNSVREFGATLTVSGVTFSGRYLLASNYRELTSTGTVLFNFDSSGPLTITFDSPVIAFGADYGCGSGAQFPSFTATLTLDSGEVFTFTSPTNPDSTFFGFIADQPVRSLVFSDGGQFRTGLDYFYHEETIKDIYMAEAVFQAPFAYKINNGTATITGYKGPGGMVNIPDTIANFPVTAIGAQDGILH